MKLIQSYSGINFHNPLSSYCNACNEKFSVVRFNIGSTFINLCEDCVLDLENKLKGLNNNDN